MDFLPSGTGNSLDYSSRQMSNSHNVNELMLSTAAVYSHGGCCLRQIYFRKCFGSVGGGGSARAKKGDPSDRSSYGPSKHNFCATLEKDVDSTFCGLQDASIHVFRSPATNKTEGALVLGSPENFMCYDLTPVTAV